MTGTVATTPEYGLAESPLVAAQNEIISFLKWRFAQNGAGAYQWKPETEESQDQGGSEVFISADTPVNSSHVGQRPAITVMRASAAFQGTGLNDRVYLNWATGSTTRLDIVPTNIMVCALSRIPVEAERLAWFCAKAVFDWREEIIKHSAGLFLYLGQRASVMPPTPAGALVQDSANHEWCAVVAGFPCYLNESSSIHPLNKKILRGVNTTISED